MYTFNVEYVTEKCIEFIRDFFDKNGKGCNCVIGISGGKDSSVCAALAKKALGKNRVLGVLMPCGEQPDIDYSYKLVQELGINSIAVNIGNAVKELKNSLESSFSLSTQSVINISPRIRMATLYAVAQSNNGRVMNTSNLSERWIGYSTRYGDSVGDFAPLFNITATEVVKIGEYLGLSETLTKKAPSDGLSGKTDEDNIGFKYADLDRYIRTGACDENVLALIIKKHTINKFKLFEMPSFILPELQSKIKE